MKKVFKTVEPEAILWATAMIVLFFVNPYSDHHYSFCIFSNIGLEFCPGCGLGRSIAFLYRGDLAASFEAHPLGILTFAFIVGRIIRLLFRSYGNYKYISGGQHGRCISVDARSSGR